MELGTQFAAMQTNATEIRKTTMADEIKETFEKLDEKRSEMETLIDQSTEVLRKTTDQVDGALKIVSEKLRAHDVNFNQILAKVTTHGQLLSRHSMGLSATRTSRCRCAQTSSTAMRSSAASGRTPRSIASAAGDSWE